MSNDRCQVAAWIDSFTDPSGSSALGTSWRLVTDGVMGGVSGGRMQRATLDGEAALCLEGTVRLEHNGGFVQMNLELAPNTVLDASDYAGLWLRVRGNGEQYGIHLKTPATQRPWQSYRAVITPDASWTNLCLPFAQFHPHRLDTPLDPAALQRLGIVAIGRAFKASICLAGIGFYTVFK